MTGLMERLVSWSPELAFAAGQTLYLTLASFVGATLLALPVCALRMSRSPSLRGIAIAYIEVARGLPVLVILFIIYFGLPNVIPDFRWSSMTLRDPGLFTAGKRVGRRDLSCWDPGRR